jgi:hypothetical protein
MNVSVTLLQTHNLYDISVLGYLPTKIVIKTITWKEISKKVRIGLQIVANYAQRETVSKLSKYKKEAG